MRCSGGTNHCISQKLLLRFWTAERTAVTINILPQAFRLLLHSRRDFWVAVL
jgi:hypothetical protein